MKLRYYLRGLGIGIVVTAIIMSFTRQPEKLTDAQIKMRALELGMIEESVLADLQKDEETTYEESVVEEAETPEVTESEEVVEEEAVTEETMTEESNSEKVDGEDIVEEEISVEEVAAEDTIVETDVTDEIVAEETDVESVIIDETVTETLGAENIVGDEVIESYIIISVASGNGSEVVSRKLYEAGLVNSAVEYNQFLVRNGYDRKLRVGNHEIPAGATEEEMAKILCGMK